MHTRHPASHARIQHLLLFLLAGLLAPVCVHAQGPEGELYGFVRSWLIADGWNPEPVPGAPAIESGFEGKNGAMFCRAHMLEDKRQIVFYSILPNRVPRERRVETCLFLTRANYGLVIGNFEIDLDDGEIRFKTSLDIEGGEITPTMLETLVYINVLTMDRYLPGLNAVMFAGAPPNEAMKLVEQE